MADRDSAGRLRAQGKPVRDSEAKRRADRERDRRQHAEREAAGLCVKCGRAPAAPERTQCEPCAERRLAAGRARHARARTSKACINPARPCRPCKRPPYAAPLRAQRRRPFPLPRPPGPTPRCFRR